jgi:hypothetical protein
MSFAIKAEVRDPHSPNFEFLDQKTMYRGRLIAVGDTIFLFESEHEEGRGLFARGIVTRVQAIAKAEGVGRQTPRVSVSIRRTALAKRVLGRRELKPFTNWKDGKPATEINFKFYRQATNKIVGVSDEAAAFLATFF